VSGATLKEENVTSAIFTADDADYY